MIPPFLLRFFNYFASSLYAGKMQFLYPLVKRNSLIFCPPLYAGKMQFLHPPLEGFYKVKIYPSLYAGIIAFWQPPFAGIFHYFLFPHYTRKKPHFINPSCNTFLRRDYTMKKVGDSVSIWSGKSRDLVGANKKTGRKRKRASTDVLIRSRPVPDFHWLKSAACSLGVNEHIWLYGYINKHSFVCQ